VSQCQFCGLVSLSLGEAMAHLYGCTNRLRTLGMFDVRRPLNELFSCTVPIWSRADG